MSFYVTLISDCSRQFLPDNKVSYFTTQLPSLIELNSAEWEVGLVDLIYPHTWYNVRNDNNLFGFDLGNGEIQGKRIAPGYYDSIQNILKEMIIEPFKNKIDISFHKVTKRVTIKTTGNAKVVLYEGLAELLGFKPGVFKGKNESPFTADPNVSFPVMYVYCDLLEPQIVGDVQAPLLKIVRVEGTEGEVINAHFVRPHYVPVIRKHFQTVQIELRLNSGQLVPFEKGKVFLVLHFHMKQIV